MSIGVGVKVSVAEGIKVCVAEGVKVRVGVMTVLVRVMVGAAVEIGGEVGGMPVGERDGLTCVG